LEIDPENVEAMVGSAVLDMMNLDETSSDFNSQMERAIKMMSMANLLDPSNAMVQNHLANHYFWKWTAISGTVEVTQGSKTVKGSQPIPVDVGDRIRIGTEFESLVADDGNEDEEVDGTTFQLKDVWKGQSANGLKIWKKDYDRVIALAKGAYNSTSVSEIQAESLFLLARVYHVRGMMDDAQKVYERAVKLSPTLTPARFGLAQTMIYNDETAEAAAHLQLVLGTSNTATDAWATLGLLEVKAGGKKTEQGLAHLRKAIDLDPLNPDLVLLEALALQQHESSYPKALERYKKATQLLKRQGKPITFDIYTNIGVLSHETRNFEESMSSYKQALDAIDEDGTKRIARIDNVGLEGGKIRHKDNGIFFDYLDSGIKIENPSKSDEEEGVTALTVIGSEGKEAGNLVVKVGDAISLGKTFESEVEGVDKENDKLVLRIKDPFKGVKKQQDEDTMDVEAESMDDFAYAKEITVRVKRENNRLSDPVALSIAFNLARLHEVAGKPDAAIELHKAILKRNPAYVNSYLRLACISIDCGALNECAGWLKIAAETAPGNPEVLTLIGNLHLSLCDWAPAQQIFDGLLGRKVANVEAYALLSMGNIYFANLDIPGRYSKHLGYAGDFYKRILTKDNANAYAANGLGSVMAEKAELFKAKEVFNRVRETTGDTIADAHLNLAHIYLAQKKHPEALQMYQSYLKRTEDGTAPITSKSRLDDKVDVLHYIAFAYFDWARQTEQFNNAKAAPADHRYKQAMDHLELAIIENTSESKNSVLTYNLCMTKLQAANCVLQKLTRNIRRTADEVEDALKGLQQSLETVEAILKSKNEGAKVMISSSILNDFITHCKSNIESAQSHLEDERKREEETKEIRELQRIAAESKREEQRLQEELRKKEEAQKLEERDRRVSGAISRISYLFFWSHIYFLACRPERKCERWTIFALGGSKNRP
jgi:RNA polymerase-associated protein CTR9